MKPGPSRKREFHPPGAEREKAAEFHRPRNPRGSDRRFPIKIRKRSRPRNSEDGPSRSYRLYSSLDDHGGGGAEPPDRFGEGPAVLGGGRMNLISKSLWPLADVTISEETSHDEGDDDAGGGVKSHVSLDGSQ